MALVVVAPTDVRARMVAISRRKRMVAHNIADVPFLFAVMLRRRLFFQEDPSIVLLTLGLYIMPPDKVEVEPCFVVAAVISQAQAHDFMRNGESTMEPYFPVPIGFRRFKEPTNVSPVARDRSGSPQRCGAGRHRQGAVGKGFFDGTEVVPVVAPPCSTRSTFSSNITARIVRISFFPMPRFLA